jgi:hypothetical protein
MFACMWWCPAHIALCFVLFFFVLTVYVASFSGLSICGIL